MIFGDLLASGQIRYAPEGHRGQTFTSPGNFLRAMRLYYSHPPPTGDSWRIVYYKGIPLSLLRDATMSEEAALAAIAAQNSLTEYSVPPSGESTLPARSPTPINAAGTRGIEKSQRPPHKRARETSVSSEGGVNLDSRDRELDAFQSVTQHLRCERCGSAENEGRMLLCDRCNRGTHMDCLSAPLSQVPAGDWYCGACQARGESSGEGSSSSSELKVFEVEDILEKRLTRGRVDYLVRWKGFDSSADSWEPRANLHCDEQLKAFEVEWRASRALQLQPVASTCWPPPAESTATTLHSPLPNLDAYPVEEPAPDRCSCRAPCTLLPLVERQLLSPGEGVLSVCCKGALTFANLDVHGSIISVGGDGQKVTYRFPCCFVHVARQRAGCVPLSVGRCLNIYSHVNYKGVRLDMVRPQPARQSKR